MECLLFKRWKKAVVVAGLGLALIRVVSADAGTGTASTAQPALAAVGGLDKADRPDGVPDDYVIAPIGYFSPSCIVGVEADEVVEENTHSISKADGSRRPMPSCTHPYYRRTGKTTTGKPIANEVVYPDGHRTDLAGRALPVTDASGLPIPVVTAVGGLTTWYNYASLGRLTASWTIPPNPTVDKTVFYWPAFNGGQVQPVLGWENLGWTLSSWYCCSSGNYMHGAFFSTTPGHHGEGDIYSTCPPGTSKCAGWMITTRDITTGQVSIIKYAGTEDGSEVIGMAVESYAAGNCGAYPSNGALIFHDVTVYDVNFKLVALPPWNQGGAGSGCLISLKPTPTTVKVTYGAPQ
jgi:hypothetical protein